MTKRRLTPARAAMAAPLLLALTLGAMRVGLLPGALLERAERATVDARFLQRGPRPVSPEIAVVLVDDPSFTADPVAFERRAGWARLVDGLAAEGAKVVAIDALFIAPESLVSAAAVHAVRSRAQVQGRPPPDALVALGRFVDGGVPAVEDGGGVPLEDAALLDALEPELRGDEVLSASLSRADVVLGAHLGLDGNDAERVGPPRGRFGQVEEGALQLPTARSAQIPMAPFVRASKAVGFISVEEDESRTVREMTFALRYGEHLYGSLAVQGVTRLLGLERSQLAWDGPARTVRLGSEHTLALDAHHRLTVDYAGPAGTFPTFSAIDVVTHRIPRGALAGKLVFVGLGGLGQDVVRTPFGPAPGVELHASAAEALLRGRSLHRVDPGLEYLLAWLLGLLAALAWLPRLPLSEPQRFLAGPLVALGWVAFTFQRFGQGSWWALVGPTLVILGTSVVALAVAYLGEGAERRALRETFSRYLGEDVLAELARNPASVRLGGERRHLTMLFSDIRSFSSFSERLQPEQLVSLLNEYLTPMTRAVLIEGGLLDKYIGDAVMAVFGAPVVQPDHVVRGLDSALRMHAAMPPVVARFASAGVPLAIGIGINSGEVVVGNMGSEERFDYTVAGDAVNLASRLEGLTKTYGAFCLVGQATRIHAPAAYRFREVDRVQVKGKTEAVAIHELLGGPGHEIARYEAMDRFEAGRAAYDAGDFEAARGHFEAFAAANPHDAVAPLHLERMEEFGFKAPTGWNGVHTFTTK